jgi:hypothetical protein
LRDELRDRLQRLKTSRRIDFPGFEKALPHDPKDSTTRTKKDRRF